MGNREDLLAGARRCLEEKGWGRTTVRDIATASGVSMAAIGYHFGSREALLNAALIEAMDEWGHQVGAALSALDDAGQQPADRFAAMWAQLIASINEHRTLWLANLEALVQAEHSPELREQLVAGQREGRRGMAAQLTGVPEEEITEGEVRAVGSVNLALLLGVMAQWLNDPEAAPSAAEVVEGLRTITTRFGLVR
ncbi:TetR family transcriptional regulator [Nonomuraea sp. WAC 01424]|uniref:TetR/AcrR family transcriptional regulator n=1 Tax=Nonomuraea sp. WAC 01424 TaxID=2203200 RepID=UPI000F7B6E97|nr:TetR/AcrR family transcriptional regulator [Nonomuraea sp. WAC 01424]RSM97103.1 TetR family transcriptional regulator [Nonomuraea sp. WAC 01424]